MSARHLSAPERRWLRGPDGRSTELLVGAGVLVVGGAIGALSVGRPGFAAAVLAVLVGLVLVVRRPVAVAVLAVPGCFVVQRVGALTATPGSSGGISYSDALIAAAAALSLPALAGTRRFGRAGSALVGVAAYLVALLPSLLLNRTARADLEWLHRGILLGGSLLVGAWLVAERMVSTALRLLGGVGALLGVAAAVDSLAHGFAAAQPLDLNKNFLGSLLGVVAVLYLAAGRHLAEQPWARAAVITACLAGLLATQSRGAMLGAAFALVVAFFADVRRHRPTARVAMVGASLILMVAAAYLIREQLQLTQADFANSSAGLRLTVESATRRIWATSPLTGVGLRYYDTPLFGSGTVAANNVIDNELAESGVIGAVGFLALQVVLVVVLARRRRQPLAAAALGLVMGQLLHGMVDIYWTAGVVSLPLLIAGMAVAAPVDPAPEPPAPGQPAGGHPARMRPPGPDRAGQDEPGRDRPGRDQAAEERRRRLLGGAGEAGVAVADR